MACGLWILPVRPIRLSPLKCLDKGTAPVVVVRRVQVLATVVAIQVVAPMAAG